MSNEKPKKTKAFETITGDLELGAHDSMGYTSPDYQVPHATEQRDSGSFFSRMREKATDLRDKMRGKKIGRKAAAIALVAGAGFGLERAAAAEDAAEKQHVAEMNAKFEPIVKPAAEKAAQFAVDKIMQAQETGDAPGAGYGRVTQDKDDATRFDIYFSGETNGTTYTISAEVGKKKGKDKNGNDIDIPDVTQVTDVEIFEKSGDRSSTTTLSTEDSIYEDPYWGVSRAYNSPVDKGAYSTYDNEGAYADDLENNLDTARKISKDTDELIAKLSETPKAS